MQLRTVSQFVVAAVLAAAACIAGCAAPLGPGYLVRSQTLDVRFDPANSPHVLVKAEYDLENTGNRPLQEIEIRFPGRFPYQVTDAQTVWDGVALTAEATAGNPHNSTVELPEPWKVSERHALRISFTLENAAAGQPGLRLAADAFLLPSSGWYPQLAPLRGMFGFGGSPPDKWKLTVTAPDGFLVHTSGQPAKLARNGGQLRAEALQRRSDRFPFVIGGRYKASSANAGQQRVRVWTRQKMTGGELQSASASLARVINVYNDIFGARGRKRGDLWLVECPAQPGCFSGTNKTYAEILGEDASSEAQMVSLDTLVFDPQASKSGIAAAAAPSLAAGWLGYGRNPGFHEQAPPLFAFPAFAAAAGIEATGGPGAAQRMVGRALEIVGAGNGRQPESDEVVRAKSFLFFYALRDQYGDAVFRNALRHMLRARRGRGFDLDDLIAAFEQETHQNVAAFVRLWMKHPGVPQEFRDRHAAASAAAAHLREAVP